MFLLKANFWNFWESIVHMLAYDCWSDFVTRSHIYSAQGTRAHMHGQGNFSFSKQYWVIAGRRPGSRGRSHRVESKGFRLRPRGLQPAITPYSLEKKRGVIFRWTACTWGRIYISHLTQMGKLDWMASSWLTSQMYIGRSSNRRCSLL